MLIEKENFTSSRSESPIIELDEDTRKEEESPNGGLYPYDANKIDIDIREDPTTVFELIRKHKRGSLILNPDYQRNLVWKHEQKSQFVESILLNFPLPPFYLNQNIEGKYIVVDGLQRISTMYQFMNDQFPLKGLKVLGHLNKKHFSELPDKLQAKIEDKKLHIYVIRPSVPIEVVYDIFYRINTGGTQLNRQEIRNGIFIGKSTELLKELSETDYFIDAIGAGISPKRMKDREAVLRYLAFKIFDYQEDYKGNMSDFVENAMKKINLMEEGKIESLKQDFERVMKKTYDFFGERNFRLPTEETRGRINMAMLESVAYFFSDKSDDFLQEHQEKITSNFDTLLKDEVYLDAIRFSTGDKSRVLNRFKKVEEILGKV